MKQHFLLLALCLSTSIVSLESVSRAESHGHPDLAAKAGRIKRIGLLPPRIDMFEIGAGGSLEQMAEWERTARFNIRQSLLDEFAKRDHLRVTDFDEGTVPAHLRPTYDETFLLYDKVWSAILTHAFKWQHASPATQVLFFPEKARDFRYSLGKEVAGLAPESDALLVVRGFDQRSSGGRKALGVATTIIGAALGVNTVPRRGSNIFTASLIDSNTGDILWFSHSLKPHDLRDVEEARQLAVDFMIDLPMLGQMP